MIFIATKPPPKGFALISTITIMVLLVVIALATISISTLESKASSQSKNETIAKANARLALSIAISKLQLHLGDDRRISTPASQSDSALHKNLIAAYDARSIEDELSNTLPTNYYNRSTNFRSWLVSHPDPAALEGVEFANTGTFPDPITLKANPTNPTLNLKASKIQTTNGKLAWIVQDESLKARIDLAPPTTPQPSNLASQMITAGLPSKFAPQIQPDFASLTPDDPIYKKFITQKMLQLFPSLTSPIETITQDITPFSIGLLTDNKKGGLKHDLNLLLELPEADLPPDYLNFENYSSRWGGSRDFNAKKFSDITPSNTSTNLDTLPVSLIQTYYQTYKLSAQQSPESNDGSHTIDANGRPRQHILGIPDNNSNIDRYWRGYGHTLRTIPVVARMRDIVWASAEKLNDSTYRLVYLSFPVITLWNPYNVDTVLNQATMQYKVNPTEARAQSGAKDVTTNVGGRLIMEFGQNSDGSPIVFAPGETKLFFPNFASSNAGNINMVNEWPANFNNILNFKTATSSFQGPGTTNVKLSLGPSKIKTYYNETHRNDAWISPDIHTWKGTKFHNWTFDLSQVWDTFTGGEDSLTSTLSALAARPRPIGITDIGLKSADSPDQPGLLWKFDYPQRMNNRLLYPSLKYGSSTPSPKMALAGRQAATLHYRYTSLRGDTDLAKHLSSSEDSLGVHDYMGYSHTPDEGASFITLCELPLMPLSSLGQLQHLPLLDEDWYHDYPQPITPSWTFTIGNSDAHPWLSSTKLYESQDIIVIDATSRKSQGTRDLIDRLSVANSLLFDSYFFSTATPQNNSWFQSQSTSRTLKQVLTDASSLTTALPNNRLHPTSTLSKETIENDLLEDNNTPTQEAYKLIAKHLKVHGAFNINATSLNAWKILLASTMRKELPTLTHEDTSSPITTTSPDKYILSRYQIPNGPSIDEEQEPYKHGYNGYREITEQQIDQLATAIVAEVKKRGPFRSLSEFVNRRRSSDNDSEMNMQGAIATALKTPEVTINNIYGTTKFEPDDFPDATFTTPKAMEMNKASGLPGFVNQADVLTPIAPIITCRGDTFTIRAYGEATDSNGNTLATAACEAVIQRTINFVDPVDKPETPIQELKSIANQKFGRRFKIIHFRWLNTKELTN